MWLLFLSLHEKMSVNWESQQRHERVNRASTEHQLSINNFGCCILYEPRAVLLHLPIIEVLVACIGNIVCVDTATPQIERQHSVNRTSTERRQSINPAWTDCQQSDNDFGCCILYNPRALLWHIPIIIILATVMNKRNRNMVTAPVWT